MQLRDFLASEQLGLELFNALPDALFVADTNGRIVAVNATARELFGYAERDLVGQNVELLLPSSLRAQHEQARREFILQPSQRSMGQGRELRAVRADGRELSVQIALSPLHSQGALFVLVTVRETPDYVRALRESEERYHSALEQAPDAVFVADLTGRYTDVNSAACKMLGYTREQLIGKTIMDLIPTDDLPRLSETRGRLLRPGEADVDEWTLLRADGVRVPVEVSSMIHTDGRWQAFVRDITERKQAAEAQARFLRELETVLETLPDPVAIRTGDVFAYVNPAWLHVLGYQDPRDLIGKPVLDSMHPDDHTIAAARLAAPALGSSIELRLLAKDGSPVPLDFSPSVSLHYHGQPAHLVVAHDRRDEKRMAATLAIRDRLVTVGTLAAGVGHEINNPLQHVTMNLELLRDELQSVAGGSPSARFRDLLDMAGDALRGAERIRKIVLGLHTFSRGEREEPCILDVRSVLELALNLVRNELRHRARVELDLEHVPKVLADESRLAQVFINILINAVQAMPERDESDNLVRIATRTDPQGRAVVEIRDNGAGMTPQTRARIFEPFFTTKAVGQGTGLGLAISYNIVASLGGLIECDSELGVGTTFRIVLQPAEPWQESQLRQLAPGSSRRGKILVIDDEPIVAKLLERVLSREHQVDVAADGEQALALLASRPDYDVVLCDLMMPHMNGMELFQRIARDAPGLTDRFVFMTGGTTRADAQAFLDSVPNEKLYKPFSVPNVRSLVSRLLEARQASGDDVKAWRNAAAEHC
ncbi:MAG TPA: PAS domain S-box protein [Polyangiaceae bacterium]|nr:PAS domain S-box protein [Polyangiaceae bacterium]